MLKDVRNFAHLFQCLIFLSEKVSKLWLLLLKILSKTNML